MEDLKALLLFIQFAEGGAGNADIIDRWEERLIEAVADQEFNNKQLNFNAPNT